MSLELNQLPRYVFQAAYTTNKAIGYYGSNNTPGARKYLEIPINKDVFEVPIFAMLTFIDLVKNNLDNTTQAIAAQLYSRERDLRYVSVDRYMRDVLVDDFQRNRLLKCYAKSKEGNVKYYGTHGAVFNEEFIPVAMCSWLIERVVVEESDKDELGMNNIYRREKYRFVHPIFRIDPHIYVSQQDTMEKFLAKKFVALLLSEGVLTPHRDNLPQKILLTGSYSDNMSPSIYIENNPFSVTTISEPTIDTTNEELREAALEHIDEVIQ